MCVWLYPVCARWRNAVPRVRAALHSSLYVCVPCAYSWSGGYIADLLPEQVDRLVEMISDHVPKLLKWLRAHTNEVPAFCCLLCGHAFMCVCVCSTVCLQVIKSSNQNLLQSFLHLLNALLTPENGVRGSGMNSRPRTTAEKRADEVCCCAPCNPACGESVSLCTFYGGMCCGISAGKVIRGP